MEGFPNRFPKPSSEEENKAPAQEDVVSPDAIKPIAEALEKRSAERVADTEPNIPSEYELPPDRADDLNETLRNLGL